MAETLMSEQLIGKINSSESVDLRGLITSLRKYKWLIILFTMFATLLTVLVVSSVTPVYRSTVTLLFEKEKAKTGYENPWGEIGNLEDEIQTQLQILRSRGFAKKVVTELNLQDHWEYNPSLVMPARFDQHGPLAPIKASLKDFMKSIRGERKIVSSEPLVDRMARRFSARVKMFPVKGTSLMRISVEGIDKEMTTKVANGAAELYLQVFLDNTSGRNLRAREFLREKVDEFKVNLDRSEQALLEQRRKYGIQGDGGKLSSDLSIQTLGLLNSRLLDAKARLENARIQWNKVQNTESGITGEVVLTEINGSTTGGFVGTAYEKLSIVDSNTMVQKKKQEMQEAQRLLGELDNRYGQKHPRVVDAKSNLQVAVGNLDRQIANVVSSVENKFLATEGEVKSLQADIRRAESRQYGLSEGRAAINEVELKRDTDRSFYEDAIAELKDFQESDRATVPITIADFALVPRQPFRPRESLVTMLGFLLSLAGISVLVCAYETKKETAKGVNSFEKKLGVRVLGIIPTVKSRGSQREGVPLIPGGFEDKRNMFKEAMRTLRTRSTLSDLENDEKVIMVTSTVPGEGKSTVAVNLAYSLSKLENVVLVEADFRRPGIGRALGVKSDGLTDLLERKVYFEDCIRTKVIGHLDVLPAGKPRENDLELLASTEFGELIELLKSRYDRVVLDLAPVQAVSDAMVVGKYADTAIYVVKADSTPLPLVEHGISLVREVGVKISGAVISQINLARLRAYGGDYYYFGYFDYYGYADKTEVDAKSSALVDYAERSRKLERERQTRKKAERQSIGNSGRFDPIIRTG